MISFLSDLDPEEEDTEERRNRLGSNLLLVLLQAASLIIEVWKITQAMTVHLGHSQLRLKLIEFMGFSWFLAFLWISLGSVGSVSAASIPND